MLQAVNSKLLLKAALPAVCYQIIAFAVSSMFGSHVGFYIFMWFEFPWAIIAYLLVIVVLPMAYQVAVGLVFSVICQLAFMTWIRYSQLAKKNRMLVS